MGFPTTRQHYSTRQDRSDGSADSLQDQYADWPQRGDERAQPWDHREVGYDASTGPDDEAAGPVEITHSHGLLTSGSGGAEVFELCRLLKRAGYPTSVTRGENAFSTYDQSVADAVERFKRDYGVGEDPGAFGGDNRLSDAHVGPYTWQALIRVADRDD